MRLIDAESIKSAKYHALPYTHIHPVGVDVQAYEMGWNDALDAVMENAPTVDAVEVVRCKDCKECEERHTANYLPFLYCKLHQCGVLHNFFCCWAERREDETD